MKSLRIDNLTTLLLLFHYNPQMYHQKGGDLIFVSNYLPSVCWKFGGFFKICRQFESYLRTISFII